MENMVIACYYPIYGTIIRINYSIIPDSHKKMEISYSSSKTVRQKWKTDLSHTACDIGCHLQEIKPVYTIRPSFWTRA